MQSEDLVQNVQGIKASLEETEKWLKTIKIPREVLEDFKSTVDFTRITLWGILTAADPDVRSVLTRFRVKHIVEMCQKVTLDASGGDIPSDSPALLTLRAALQDTLSRLKHADI